MTKLITAEEFAKRPDPGYPEELVRGKVVAMSVPDRRHGYVCPSENETRNHASLK